ncbi:MAG: hypothetical protein JRH10_15400 [Deltaproteobacteria bacterium]|nr:hypothetical protein [Deltaproteobacteria bacterium]MBW2448212.1 hypothetical protein [Deltaproteobacteria bacterium]
MIFFLVTKDGRHVLDKYLASWGGEFFERVRVVPYATLPEPRRFEPGVYVFADLERLSPDGRRAAGRVWAQLAQEPERYHLLNHPERSLDRRGLLQALHERGLNDHGVDQLDDWAGLSRYPVFLRRAGDHVGPRTPLLWDAGEVESAIAESRREHGDLSDWIVVEFTDCSDDAGYHRKYAAMMLDGVLIPRHLFVSRNWVQKWADLRGGTWAEEELAYVRDGAHAELLRPIFELAGLQYGRIDYSIGKNGLQVWEINTNPILLDAFDRKDTLRLDAHRLFAKAWGQAFGALCARAPEPTLRLGGPGRLVDRAFVEKERLKETPPGRWLRRLNHRLAGSRRRTSA